MSSTTNPPPNVILSTIWNVPYNRNPNFTGREKQLEEIHRSLNSRDPLQRAQAIYGLGGVGKTQLALEYAYRHRDEYAIIWWVRAEESTTLITDFLRLSTHLSGGTVIDAPPEIICDAIRRALDRRSDWLLIIDNAPSPNLIGHVLPQGRSGNVIITSRNPNWRGLANPYHLGMLERAEAIQFLKKRTGAAEADETASRLADALGDLPLALEQAGACIEQARITFNDYLDRYETHRQEILRLSPPATDYPDTIATTWDISFEKVRAASRAAGDLLNLCAFLSPDEIRRDLLFRGAHVIPYPLATTVSNTVMFDSAISTLLQYSLVDANEQAISMHRLVAAITRDRLTEDERRRWTEVALRLINDAFAFESIDVGTWSQCSALMAHVMATTAQAEALNIVPEVTSSLLNEAGRYLLRNGRFKDSLELLERALTLTRKTRGDKHSTVSAIVNDLGRVHMRLGNLAEARHYYEWALGIDEPAYGHDHPHVATIVNNYGMCLMATGDSESALQHFEWALTVYRTHFGDKHPKTASTLSNLGYARMKLGQSEAARAHFEQALAVAESTLGVSHPTVASIHHNLGTVLRVLGHRQEACEHFEHALAIDQAAYIPTHPDVVRDVNSLGETLTELNDIKAARAHYQKAIENVQKLHGQEHPRLKELQSLLAQLPQ